jgi:hypothetical protein
LRAAGLRPKQAPQRIPHWAWGRLHFFLRARASASKGHRTKQTTSTGTTTTTPLGGVTYDQAISYTQTRPAFAPTRTVSVSSASGFKSALSNLQSGDLVKATGPFTVSGETVISKQLSSYAVLDLGSYVTFENSSGQNSPAVWLNNPSYLRIYGGTATTDKTGGSGILVFGSQHVLWWGFNSHDNGGDGIRITPNIAPTQNDDFQGELAHNGLNLAWDPHTEKGSGLHAANLDDSGKNPFHDNRFAFYIHDQPTGAGIQYGSSGIAPTNNTIYEKAVNLTFISQTQTGGNAIQFWGVNGQTATLKYLETNNTQGYALFDGGMYQGTTLNGVTVQNGHATHTNQNPRYNGQNPWQTNKNVAYKSVTPPP